MRKKSKKSKKSKKRMMKVVSATMACSILAGSTSLLNVQKVQAAETTSAEIHEKNINDVTMNEAQVDEKDVVSTEVNEEEKVQNIAEKENDITKGEDNKIHSMDYFSANDGPVITKSGVGEASYGFVMPVFNGGLQSYADVASDLVVNVKVDGKWVDIDKFDKFKYNSNWGNWNDGGFSGYWFKLSETTEIQLVSKSNSNVTLDYKLVFNNLSKSVITSMKPTQGPNIKAGVTGGAGFTYPSFNGDSSVIYDQVSDDLIVYVWSDEEDKWINLFNNAASGWIYDKNFGQFTDGGGGYWFNVDKTTKVRVASISSPDVYIDYVIEYDNSERNNYNLSADTTTYKAGDTGAIGIPLPKIDGGYPRGNELDGFVYEIKINDKWEELGNGAASGFSYQGNGYNKLSDKNQWGYWVDGIYGLWFQPIQEDMELRIGYPGDGVKGHDIGENYVYYNFVGNPNAPRPDVSDLGNIQLGTEGDSQIDGWKLIWNEEFASNSLDLNKWNYNTGYYINNDPSMWGWGNNELEYYTDSEKNIYLEDGKLNLKVYYEPKIFSEIDPNRVAPYSSGKITTKDKFAFKYGRVDFRAKLPKGTGIWPALWMLPNDDVYGPWAASGEIDVMEARGRLPQSTSGTIHFGGTWPSNTYLGSDYSFKNGQAIDTGYHVYSVVWEDDNIKWYVDGNCFFKATKDQWYSLADKNNDKAPFDQDFYIIMNLAVGGWFDGGLTPNEGDIPATMKVDYVRVYKEDGDNGDVQEEYKDVALGKNITCSGYENDELSIKNINDNNLATRWSSNFDDNAWFDIDLGEVYNINGIDLNWEQSYGKKYEIMLSEDGINYTTAFNQENGNGGEENIKINNINARYVKFKGIERALPYGYSLWDVKVMGK